MTRAIAARRVYPAQALRRRVEGTITVRLVIGRDGRLLDVEEVPPGGPAILAQAALDAVRQAAPFPPLTGAAGTDRGIVDVLSSTGWSRGGGRSLPTTRAGRGMSLLLARGDRRHHAFPTRAG